MTTHIFSAGVTGGPTVHEATTLHPIHARVYIPSADLYGTVRLWQFYRGQNIYIVRLDRGWDALAMDDMLERARPRRGWRPVVVKS